MYFLTLTTPSWLSAESEVILIHTSYLTYGLTHDHNVPQWDMPSPMKQDVSHLNYDAAILFWKIIVNIFFREIRPRGAFNIPKEGPVIFVAAPHNNQVNTIYEELEQL